MYVRDVKKNGMMVVIGKDDDYTQKICNIFNFAMVFVF
jgi:hypothetical protein